MKDGYDRDTSQSRIVEIRRITSMALAEDEDLIKHLDAFLDPVDQRVWSTPIGVSRQFDR
jgi:hypothetical protein